MPTASNNYCITVVDSISLQVVVVRCQNLCTILPNEDSVFELCTPPAVVGDHSPIIVQGVVLAHTSFGQDTHVATASSQPHTTTTTYRVRPSTNHGLDCKRCACGNACPRFPLSYTRQTQA